MVAMNDFIDECPVMPKLAKAEFTSGLVNCLTFENIILKYSATLLYKYLQNELLKKETKMNANKIKKGLLELEKKVCIS